MKRALVTGGRGFIGRNILIALIESGFEVHATASDDRISRDLAKLPVTWHVCDLLKSGAAELLIKRVKPSHLLHAAWITDHGDYWTSSQNLSWLATTAAILRAFSEVGGTRYVGVGTCAEYEWASDIYDEETTPELPATLYGEAKLAAHRIAMAAGEHLGYSAATGRIFFAYGPHENPNRILPYACCKLLHAEPAQFSSGNLDRDFLHVKDAGIAFATLLDSKLSGAVNIASGQTQRLGDLVTSLGRIAGRNDLIELGARPDRPEDPPTMVANIGRISSIGWRPSISIGQGLQETYEWWRDQKTGATNG